MTEYDVWLAGINGIGNATLRELWETAGRRMDFAEELYRMREGELESYLGEVCGIRALKIERICEARALVTNRGQSPREKLQVMEDKGIRYVWMGEAEYPARLLSIEDPPFGLYVKGRLPKAECAAVGIVGTRMASPYGREQARIFAAELAREGVQIISGMARGVDGVAGRGALDTSDNSYAVLGGGVDICYPRENKDLYEALTDRGGLLSEYRPGLAPQSNFFPSRNRIISGLSDIILVIEAREQSGTLITVDRALEQGKDVWALPGRRTDRNSTGCNRLIRQGAGIALSPELILEALGLREAEESAQDTGIGYTQMTFDFEALAGTESAVARAILECLDFAEPRSLDSIAPEVSHIVRREVPFREMMKELTHLTLRGCVKEIRVGQYVTATHLERKC